MNNLWTVYKHTFPNDKVYIGITSFDVSRRWKKDGCGYKNQGIISNAIKKYGWDNVKHEILFNNLSEQEAKQKEQELIEFYHSYYLDPLGPGYNMTKGGDGNRKLNYEKMEQLYHQGLTTIEIANRLNCNKGTVREGLHSLGYTNLRRKKCINQYDMNGNFIKTYPSISEAAKETGIDYRNISDVLRHKIYSIHNYRWTYSDEELQKIIYVKSNSSETKKDRIPKSNKICQYNLYGNLVKIYDNIQIAARENNVAASSIRKAINKVNGTSAKSYWKRYEENGNNDVYIIDKNSPIKFKPVLQYDGYHNLIQSFSTVGDAAKAMKTEPSNICSAINKRVDTCEGYYWEYYEQQL